MEKFLSDHKNTIVDIAGFLKEIALTHGVIRIYGFNLRAEGYGVRKDSTLPYHPNQPTTQIDPNTPNAGPNYNNRFFEIDPDKFHLFNDPDNGFIKFLGALFADYQSFIIRTDGMDSNKVIFAFSILLGSLMPSDIISMPYHPSWFRPFDIENEVLEPWDILTYLAWKSKWDSIINTLKREGKPLIPQKPSKFLTWLVAYKNAFIEDFNFKKLN